jgi:hypothetical protein
VRRPKEVFVARNLLQQVIEGRLDGRGGYGRFASGGHLARWQAEIQGHYGTFPRRVLLDHAFEVNEFRAKHLKALTQFLYLGVHFFF